MSKPTVSELKKLFADNDAADAFIIDRRWGEDAQSFQCPRCSHSGKAGSATWPLQRCRSCFTLAGPLSGSAMGKTKLRSSDVLWLTWTLATRPGGISSVEASRETGMSRQAAQRALGLIRHALAQAEASRQLSGEVEADETFLGGKGRDTNKRGRSETKQCVLVLAERHTGGKCILQHVPDAKAKTLIPIIKRGVEKGSDIYTDGHKAYGSIGKLGYKHTEHVIKGSGIRAHIMLPAVHQVAKTLKAQLQGTHKRMPKDDLLQDYLGAFQWRYNHRDLEPVDAFLAALDIVLGVEHE